MNECDVKPYWGRVQSVCVCVCVCGEWGYECVVSGTMSASVGYLAFLDVPGPLLQKRFENDPQG